MKKILVTFADNNTALTQSQQELIKQAKNYFDGYCAFSLKDIDSNFFDKNKHILIQRRGVGYWLWKPYFIKKVYDLISNDDYLFYMDSGTSIVNDITPLFKVCDDNNGTLLFENRDGNPHKEIWLNKQWTKGDCFHKMKCLEKKYYDGYQCSANLQLYKKNAFNEKFLQDYLDYSQDKDIITDIPNKFANNDSSFIDHRHDQSVLSLLAIKYNIVLQPSPSECGEGTRPKNCKYQTILWHHRGLIYGRTN